jgi:ubiquinone/menaquinone biosynthesis C-methylase UbiE
MAQHGAWQVGGSAAELYQQYLVPTIASHWAVDLIDRAAPRPGERVLDVACGTGVVAAWPPNAWAQAESSVWISLPNYQN